MGFVIPLATLMFQLQRFVIIIQRAHTPTGCHTYLHLRSVYSYAERGIARIPILSSRSLRLNLLSPKGQSFGEKPSDHLMLKKRLYLTTILANFVATSFDRIMHDEIRL